MTTTAITTLDQLLAYAHVLEQEAVERYQELAEQMQVHHQPQLAELFQTMARVEGQHVDRVEALADGRTLPRLAPWDYRWADLESPERVPIGAEQYGMQPRQALASCQIYIATSKNSKLPARMRRVIRWFLEMHPDLQPIPSQFLQ